MDSVRINRLEPTSTILHIHVAGCMRTTGCMRQKVELAQDGYCARSLGGGAKKRRGNG